jgi:hypothetical protein
MALCWSLSASFETIITVEALLTAPLCGLKSDQKFLLAHNFQATKLLPLGFEHDIGDIECDTE